MNFMDSKIACRLGNPWEHDRCPPTKPPLPGRVALYSPFSLLLQTLQPIMTSGFCGDSRKKNLPLPSKLSISNLQPQTQPILLGFCFLPILYIQEEILLGGGQNSQGLELESTGRCSQRGCLCPSRITGLALSRTSPGHLCKIGSLGSTALKFRGNSLRPACSLEFHDACHPIPSQASHHPLTCFSSPCMSSIP